MMMSRDDVGASHRAEAKASLSLQGNHSGHREPIPDESEGGVSVAAGRVENERADDMHRGGVPSAGVGRGTIRCEHLFKWFGDTAVISDLQLSVWDHEFVCVVGPSGCGKTTLLRMIGGLAEYDSGTIKIGDTVVTEPLPNVAVVFQHFGLFPWKTVAANIALPLRASGLPKVEVERRVAESIALVGLRDIGHRYPAQLSGGMRQRVGLARALAMQPEVILLDEPFAVVDAQTREILQGELLNLWSRHRQTAVFITHSIDEAVTLADRVVVMGANPGRVVAEVTIPIERPRNVTEVRRHPTYVPLREGIWERLRASKLPS